MKILYFHQYFATRESATATRSFELAKRFVERGHQVTMVSSIAQLPKDAGSGSARPRFVVRERLEGIDLVTTSPTRCDSPHSGCSPPERASPVRSCRVPTSSLPRRHR